MERHNPVARAAGPFREKNHSQAFIQRLIYLPDHSRDLLRPFAVDEDRADGARQQAKAGPICDVVSGNKDALQRGRVGDDVDITQMIRHQKERRPRSLADCLYTHSHDRSQRPSPTAHDKVPPSTSGLLERRDRKSEDQPEQVPESRGQNESRYSDYYSK